jgi:hypothetical protein
MIGDTPTVVRRPVSKTAWSEKAFQTWFNDNLSGWKLMLCSQEFNAFDFWLIDEHANSQPKLVELKAHLGKLHTDRDLVGCDFIKIQKLRSLSLGTKAFVFHLFEDCVLIQDVDTEIKLFRQTEWNGNDVLLGLIARTSCEKKLSVGLKDLRLQSSAKL